MTEPRIPWPVFFVAVAGAFVVALDLSIVNVAFPSIEGSFPDASKATLSWVLSAYSVVFGALLLGAGRIADRSGRRRWFLRGAAVFTFGSLLCGVATAPWMLIGGRVVQAVGAALLMPASLALLLGATPAALRAQAVAMWGGISALAVATGPSLGAILIDAGGWRWAFFINLPILAVVGVMTRRVVTESIVGGPKPDLFGVALLSGSVALLALGITQVDEWGWTSSAVIGALGGAVVLGIAAVQRARVHPTPAIDLTLFSNRTVALANGATFAYAVGFFAMLLANVLFLTSVWEYSTLKAGLAITPGPLVVAALSRSTGALASRVGYRPVLVVGGLVFAAAQLWSVFLMPLEPELSRPVVASEPAHRPGRGPHVPGAQRRGRGRTPTRALRHWRRRQPDRPSDGRRPRHRAAGVDPRRPDLTRGRPRRLPAGVVPVRRRHRDIGAHRQPHPTPPDARAPALCRGGGHNMSP